MKSLSCSAFVFLAAVGLLNPHNVYADAIALSSISFSNFVMKPANGSIVFGAPWTADGFAQAQNSRGELDAQFNSNAGGVATANAWVTFVNEGGSASASNLTGLASGGVNLVGVSVPTMGISTGHGTLSNTFTLTGGTGSTTVDFAAAVSGLLNVFTDSLGLQARAESIFNTQLDGNPVLFLDSLLMGGRSFTSTMPFSQTLTTTVTLNFNTPYFLSIQADSETMAITNPVPEPSTLITMLIGLGLLVGLARKTAFAKRKN